MSRIKHCFKSRWENGYIMEADFSQLEVVVLAYLSRDQQLIKDLREGVDVHSINAQHLFGKNFTAKQRKTAKSLSFQLQYGAGAASMAKENDIPIQKAKDFIEHYYSRYPDVKKWQEKIAEEVQQSRQPSHKRTATGLPAGVGTHHSLTGRMYSFQEYDAPDFLVKRGVDTSFSPTQMKNYPVQGFATGDIVPLVLGELFDALKADSFLRDKALLINTVHDSIVLDIYNYQTLVKAAATTKKVMERAPEFLRKYFGIEFDMPLPVEISYGRTWGEQEEYTI